MKSILPLPDIATVIIASFAILFTSLKYEFREFGRTPSPELQFNKSNDFFPNNYVDLENQDGSTVTLQHRDISYGSFMQVVPRPNKTFGADVFGFDPSSIYTNPLVAAEIKVALEEHLLLVFHSVSDKITPEQHLDLSRLIGPVDPEVSRPPSYLQEGVFNSPDQVKRALAEGADLSSLSRTMLKALNDKSVPESITRIVKEPSDKIAFGEGWHSDLSFLPSPPFGAVLVSRELPPVGQGNTGFLDMRAVYEALPKELVRRAEQVGFANHSDGSSRHSVHPIIRHDSKTQRPSLYVNKAFTRNIVSRGIQGNGHSSDDVELDRTLLDDLLEWVDAADGVIPEASIDLTWEDGQMIMWDNRFTQHSATANYRTRREMHRTVISGTKPF